MPWSFLAGSLGDVRESIARTTAIAVVGRALMGASVAIATGQAFKRIVPIESD